MSAPQPQSKVPQGPSASCATFAYLLGNRLAQIAYFAGGMPWRGQCCRWGRLLAALDGAFQCSGETVLVEMTNCHCC